MLYLVLFVVRMCKRSCGELWVVRNTRAGLSLVRRMGLDIPLAVTAEGSVILIEQEPVVKEI